MQGYSSESTTRIRPREGPKVPAVCYDPGIAMKRAFAAVAGAILVAAAVFAFIAVRQEREFRRLIAAGDAALARDQTYEAIEAFSGALALKHRSEEHTSELQSRLHL